MKIMELDGIIDSLEEMVALTNKERWDLRDLLQRIDDKHSYEDRENNIEVKL